MSTSELDSHKQSVRYVIDYYIQYSETRMGGNYYNTMNFRSLGLLGLGTLLKLRQTVDKHSIKGVAHSRHVAQASLEQRQGIQRG
jgi:hypothetical protein